MSAPIQIDGPHYPRRPRHQRRSLVLHALGWLACVVVGLLATAVLSLAGMAVATALLPVVAG